MLNMDWNMDKVLVIEHQLFHRKSRASKHRHATQLSCTIEAPFRNWKLD